MAWSAIYVKEDECGSIIKKKAEKLLGYIWICKMENKELKDVDFKAIEELGTNIRHYLIENNHYLC